METVTGWEPWGVSTREWVTSEPSLVASFVSISREIRGRIARNSSPPQRPTTSDALTELIRVLAMRLQGKVSGLVPELVIERLEVIDVDEQHAEWLLLATKPFEFRVQLGLQTATIGKLSQRVQERQFLQLGELLLQQMPRTDVRKQLDPANDLSLFVSQGRDPHGDGYPMSRPMPQEHLRFTVLAVLNRRRHRATALAEFAPLAIDVHEEVVPAPTPHDFLGAEAGDPLRRLVPVRDPAIPVDDVQAVMEARQDRLQLNQGFHRHCPSQPASRHPQRWVSPTLHT